MRKCFTVLLMLCIGLSAFAAFAQDRTTQGSIGGAITDPHGAAIPNATITVTGPTGTRTATTNEQGVYEVPGLNPGQYNVKIEQSGFKTSQASNVTVFVGKQATISVKFEPGAVTESVTVTAASDTD
jgi:hypothetical protein